MLLEGTVVDGMVILDRDSTPLANGTRVSIAALTGMEPAIRKTPEVCGGAACVGRRRIPVWQLVELRHVGQADSEIRSTFDPPLSASELASAWAYAAAHPDEMERSIRANDGA